MALLVGLTNIAGEAMVYGLATASALVLLGVLAVAFLLTVIGLLLSWTAHRDPACKKLLPTLGLIFNGMALLAIVPGTLWILLTLIGR